MNFRAVINVIAKSMVLEAIFMFVSMCVGFYYGEQTYLAFLIPIAILLAVGIPFSFLKINNTSIRAKEGFVIVALVWVILSLFASLPFVIGAYIPNFFDAYFEATSGLTTTGATILNNIEVLPKSILFWRSFTHWIGGMGVLVFILAVLPSDKGAMHIFRAESPGPSVGKFVSKLKHTARILYLIYIVLTIIEVIALLIAGMGLYDSVVHSLATAGTGGFSSRQDSIASFNSVAIEMVITVFMFLFSINFNVFYLILTGNAIKAFKGEEFRTFLIILLFAIIAISVNLITVYGNYWEALRYSVFQVISISSTTGFVTADFNTWPVFSQIILLFLMIVGACGGSTGGGIKVSRLIILSKSSYSNLKSLTSTRQVLTVRLENEKLSNEVINNVKTYMIFWALIVFVVALILSIDNFPGTDFFTHFSASITCIGNVGPGFNGVGPIQNFANYSSFSKIILSFEMLIGRLEIFPIFIMLSPKVWQGK